MVVGSTNLDVTVFVNHLPAPGETARGRESLTGPGGKGANQAVAARRLGADTTFVTMLGADRFGDDLAALLFREGLTPEGVLRTDRAPTGLALITVDDEGRNTIAVAPGANDSLGPDDIDRIPRLFDGAAYLLCQLEIPLQTVLVAARRARSAGAAVVLNAAPAAVPLPDAAHESFDIVVVNEVELSGLTKRNGEVTEAAGTLLNRGPSSVVVTRGQRGALCVSRRRGSDEAFSVPAPHVHAVDSTGAGDAFCGALVATLASGADLRAAVEIAVRAGAHAATRKGTWAGLPTPDDLRVPADRWS